MSDDDCIGDDFDFDAMPSETTYKPEIEVMRSTVLEYRQKLQVATLGSIWDCCSSGLSKVLLYFVLDLVTQHSIQYTEDSNSKAMREVNSITLLHFQEIFFTQWIVSLLRFENVSRDGAVAKIRHGVFMLSRVICYSRLIYNFFHDILMSQSLRFYNFHFVGRDEGLPEDA